MESVLHWGPIWKVCYHGDIYGKLVNKGTYMESLFTWDLYGRFANMEINLEDQLKSLLTWGSMGKFVTGITKSLHNNVLST